MGPLETPLTKEGKIAYFDNGTFLTADSLAKVCIEKSVSIDEIVTGETYNLVYTENNKLKRENLAITHIYTLDDTTTATVGQYILLENDTILNATAIKAVGKKAEIEDKDVTKGKTYTVQHVDKDNKLIKENLTVTSTIKGLGWGNDNYGIFSGAYGYINVFLLMLFFGGIILDKMGVRFTGVMSTGLMFIGAAIKWYAVDNSFEGEMFGLPTQVVIACLGFAIYGMGCEIAGITVTKVIAKWFKGHEMALAMGLQVALARVGTACALFFALPIAQRFGIVSAPVLFGASALCIGLISYIVYCVMDKKFDKSAGIVESSADADEQFKFSDLKVIFCNKGFWLITFLCLIFYSAVFPFLKFATNLMIIKYNVSPDLAGMIPGLLPFGTILLTPLFGSLYDKIGKGATLMLIGSILLTVVHVLFALPLLNVWWFAVIVMILLGIAFSLVPSAMWPSVPKIIPMKQLGSAYAIIFYIQNIGLSMVPVLIGNVIASNATGGTTDYTMPMSIFALFGAIAIAISVLLKIVDKKYGFGLEKGNIK
ncbi:MAG: MFS transporter [Bacteroidaceae bacterium]|nr:MFS transporter [Bacteroidaceae bacterium]